MCNQSSLKLAQEGALWASKGFIDPKNLKTDPASNSDIFKRMKTCFVCVYLHIK